MFALSSAHSHDWKCGDAKNVRNAPHAENLQREGWALNQAASWSVIGEAEFVRSSDGLKLGMRFQFFDHRPHIAADGRVADAYPLPDLPVAETRGKQTQDLLLAARQLAQEERALLARPLFPSPTASKADDIGHGARTERVRR